jgi:hypothetical protein
VTPPARSWLATWLISLTASAADIDILSYPLGRFGRRGFSAQRWLRLLTQPPPRVKIAATGTGETYDFGQEIALAPRRLIFPQFYKLGLRLDRHKRYVL